MSVDDQNGRSFLPRTRKTRALLAILAMSSPKPVLRPHLASLLWSQREKEQARASLRQSVHELQDTLGHRWSHLFAADRHNLTLRGASLQVDAITLVQPARQGPDVLDNFRHVLLEDLSGLDPAFDRWLEEERARFTRIGRTLGEGFLARSQDPNEALETAEQLLGIDRGHEGAWRAIMRAHADRGDRTMAVATYDRCRTALAEAAQARPSPETEDLIARIRADAPAAQVVDPIPLPMSQFPAWSRQDDRGDRTALRLCIAPLRTIGEDIDDGFAAGLAEEILTGLSRFRWISCVPSSLWRSAPGANPADPIWAGAEGDLVLDGTIQRAKGRLRIITQLIDMRSGGEIVWAGRFDRDMTDPLGLQDEVGAAIVAQVDPELMAHEGRRSTRRRSGEPSAQDLLLQALPALYRIERSAFLDARRMLEASLRADPGSSVVYGWLAYWDLLYVGQGWADDPGRFTNEAAELAERAVMLDPSDARALTLAGHVQGFLGKHPEEACALHERALSLNPNLAIAWCFSGLSHCYAGNHDEGLRRIKKSCRLSPSDPHIFFFETALIMPHLMRGDYASAIDVGRRSLQLNPCFSSTYKGYLAALGHMGKAREGGEVLRRLLELEPGFSVQEAVRRSPLTRPEDIDRYADGLRRAGLQEQAQPTEARVPTLLIDHTPIDLVSASPLSHALLRDDPPPGRIWNDNPTW